VCDKCYQLQGLCNKTTTTMYILFFKTAERCFGSLHAGIVSKLTFKVETSAVVSRDMSRLETVSRHYFSKSRLGLAGMKSRSRLGTLKSQKMGMSRPYLLFLLWNYFSIQICRKNPISRLPYNVQLLILRRTMAVKTQMNILMMF